MPAIQTPTGTILVQEPVTVSDKAVLYARVSSSDQKADLAAQLQRLQAYAAARGLQVAQEVSEVASGLNGKRPKLIKLLGDATLGTIVVEHRDRLSRFGFEFIEASLAAQGRRIEVLNQTEVTDDLVRDMLEVLTSFCARLYGRRGARNKARAAVEAARDAPVA